MDGGEGGGGRDRGLLENCLLPKSTGRDVSDAISQLVNLMGHFWSVLNKRYSKHLSRNRKLTLLLVYGDLQD